MLLINSSTLGDWPVMWEGSTNEGAKGVRFSQESDFHMTPGYTHGHVQKANFYATLWNTLAVHVSMDISATLKQGFLANTKQNQVIGPSLKDLIFHVSMQTRYCKWCVRKTSQSYLCCFLWLIVHCFVFLSIEEKQEKRKTCSFRERCIFRTWQTSIFVTFHKRNQNITGRHRPSYRDKFVLFGKRPTE